MKIKSMLEVKVNVVNNTTKELLWSVAVYATEDVAKQLSAQGEEEAAALIRGHLGVKAEATVPQQVLKDLQGHGWKRRDPVELDFGALVMGDKFKDRNGNLHDQMKMVGLWSLSINGQTVDMEYDLDAMAATALRVADAKAAKEAAAKAAAGLNMES